MVVQAAGGIVWREGDNGRELLLVHRPRYDDWTLPKGKLKPGESWEGAAQREVTEETGYTVRLLDYAGEIAYPLAGGDKRVRFWHMLALERVRIPEPSEVDAVAWLPPELALTKLTYPTERALVQGWVGEDAQGGFGINSPPS